MAQLQKTIYHGLPVASLKFQATPEGYLAFLGRISPEKGVDQAIAIARRAGVNLKIAAKVDRVDQVYFDTIIRPLLDGSGVEFMGEIGDSEKNEFLGGALALLTPVQWPEPFALVMIEAMACGTPVIGYARGSVPELVEHGVTGFIVSGIKHIRIIINFFIRQHFWNERNQRQSMRRPHESAPSHNPCCRRRCVGSRRCHSLPADAQKANSTPA